MKIACAVICILSIITFVLAVRPQKNGARRQIGLIIVSAAIAIAAGLAFLFVT